MELLVRGLLVRDLFVRDLLVRGLLVRELLVSRWCIIAFQFSGYWEKIADPFIIEY
jgi:hypothetical protein